MGTGIKIDHSGSALILSDKGLGFWESAPAILSVQFGKFSDVIWLNINGASARCLRSLQVFGTDIPA
jgi:hypothetical protein